MEPLIAGPVLAALLVGGVLFGVVSAAMALLRAVFLPLDLKRAARKLGLSWSSKLGQIDCTLHGVDLVVQPVLSVGKRDAQRPRILVRGMPVDLDLQNRASGLLGRSQPADEGPTRDWGECALSSNATFDPAFDAVISVEGEPAIVRSFLDVSTRSHLVDLAATYHISLESGVLQVDFRGRLTSADDLWTVMQEVASLAQRFLSQHSQIVDRLEAVVRQDPNPTIARLAFENLLTQASGEEGRAICRKLLGSPSTGALVAVRAAAILGDIDRLDRLARDSELGHSVRAEALTVLDHGVWGSGGLRLRQPAQRTEGATSDVDQRVTRIARKMLLQLTESDGLSAEAAPALVASVTALTRRVHRRSRGEVEQLVRRIPRSSAMREAATETRRRLGGVLAEALVKLEGDLTMLFEWLAHHDLLEAAAATLGAHAALPAQVPLLEVVRDPARSQADRDAARAAVEAIRARHAVEDEVGQLTIAEPTGQLSEAILDEVVEE